MEDPDSRLMEALDLLGEVADELTAQDAADELDDATLQAFWRDWPRHGAWAGALWRLLNADLEDSAQPLQDPDTEEIGGSG
jgi:hypothetical protein